MKRSVAYTLEMESYMRTTSSTRSASVTTVISKEEFDTGDTQGAAIPVSAVLSKQDAMMDMLRNFNIRLERKVAANGEKSRAPNRKPLDQLCDPIVCRKGILPEVCST